MFLMGSLLIGLSAGVIPVIIHLLHRQKTTPIAWGAMQFLIETPLQQKRRKKIEHWLLMLFRIAAVACLAVLLARPLLRDKYSPAGTVATDVAIVLDHSLSTTRRPAGTEAAGKTLFDQGSAAAQKIAGLLGRNDTLSIVLAEHQPRKLTELPLLQTDAGVLKQLGDSLKQLKPGQTDANIPEAVAAARDLANHGRNLRKLVIVITDEQRSNWQIENPEPWYVAVDDAGGAPDKNLAVWSLPLAAEAHAANLAVGPVEIGRGIVGVNRAVSISAPISNTGPTAVPSVVCRLIVDGKPGPAAILTDIPAGGNVVARFDYTFTLPGSHWAQIAIDSADAVEADNTATSAVNVLDRLPVLVIDGQLTGLARFRSSEFLQAAFQPVEEAQEAGALIQPKIVSLSDAASQKLESFAAVVVNDVPQLPGDLGSRLADYARTGHGVWIILGPRTSKRVLSDDLPRAGLIAGIASDVVRAPANEPLPGVEVREPGNAMVALLGASQRNTLAGVVTARWWSLSPAADERVILAATTGDPLILERPLGNNGGRIVTWATSADGRWNNWNLANSFVPLVQETLFHLAGGSATARNDRLDAGKPIVWTGSQNPPVMASQVTLPDGSQAQAQAKIAGGQSTVTFPQTYAPGLYALHFTPSGVPQPVYFGVNPAPAELDWRPLSDTDLAWLKDGNFVQGRLEESALGSVIGTSTRTTELWPWLAFAVVGVLLMETFLTFRMLRLQTATVATNGRGLATDGHG